MGQSFGVGLLTKAGRGMDSDVLLCLIEIETVAHDNTFCYYLNYYYKQTDEWRLSEVNKDFSVCSSYPSLVTVPKDIDDDTLRKVATFRHGGRFPVLSYYHKKNGMVNNQDSTALVPFCTK